MLLSGPLIALGTTGECATLSQDDYEALVGCLVETVKNACRHSSERQRWAATRSRSVCGSSTIAVRRAPAVPLGHCAQTLGPPGRGVRRTESCRCVAVRPGHAAAFGRQCAQCEAETMELPSQRRSALDCQTGIVLDACSGRAIIRCPSMDPDRGHTQCHHRWHQR